MFAFVSQKLRTSVLLNTLVRPTAGARFLNTLERSQAPKTQTTYKKPFTQRKQYLFSAYEHQFTTPTLLIVQHYNLSGPELMEHRRELKVSAHGARLMVVRPKMVKAVVRHTKFENMGDLFSGPMALIYWDKDMGLEAVKEAMEVVRKQKKMVLLGAKYGDSVLNVPMVEGLVDLPEIDVLRAQVLGVLQQPAQQLAAVLNRIPQRLVGVLQQKVDAESTTVDQ
ncbi:hypothetical protein BX661DRAFT_182356 [Kickxella alabastrina]|uniref:uncharacterized protein n=1 Tax=Kickxella alabastrina TaxID=61397 RepID=UPI0022205094|nr:uncharacterized protein BX661DRAFT_182356 [Kickxella alabastrina]KAI7827751.1 hypothetical protein BX661DRAFT_182356 [Kickxella alabastrina]KAJ1945905.1 hypothetical protein GGF37_001462 [Kickxella alabastrina]